MTLASLALSAVLAAALLATPALADPLPVKDIPLKHSTPAYEIDAHYPETGLKLIDEEIAAFVKAQADEIVKFATEDRQPDEPPYAYGATFEVPRNDDEMFAVVFTEYTDTGGAHPNSDFATFNYLRPDGWRVYLPEIFEHAALAKISQLAIADLTKRIGGPDGYSDPDTIKEGAGPAWDNFADFTLLPDKLHIDFPPYQVAAYAAGPQATDIPLSALSGLMRKDWRAPAASFDCAKAGTAVEKAVCSDVALARLDRAVAEAYARKLKFAFEEAEKTEVRHAQRAWLAARNAACSDAAVACLTGVYQARLKALTAEPS